MNVRDGIVRLEMFWRGDGKGSFLAGWWGTAMSCPSSQVSSPSPGNREVEAGP
jgi:hypothetical protein